MQQELINTDIKVIAETAFTHEGDVEYLHRQIDVAAKAGCHYVKFQVLVDLDSVYSKDAPIYHDIKTKLVNAGTWPSIFSYARRKGLRTVVLPVDYAALDLAMQNKDVDAIEVHSICLNDVLFLDKLNEFWLEKLIILGIGGRNYSDIRFAVNYLVNKNILLMYGFQSFPTQKTDNHLAKIVSLREEFGFSLGFADHTPWDEDDSDVIYMALALGCRVIEKHIILKAGDNRADHYSAKDAEGFGTLLNGIDRFSKIMGNADLDRLSFKETVYRNRERKIVAAKDIASGDQITREMLGYSVTDQFTDIEQKNFLTLEGRTAIAVIKKGEVITTRNIK